MKKAFTAFTFLTFLQQTSQQRVERSHPAPKEPNETGQQQKKKQYKVSGSVGLHPETFFDMIGDRDGKQSVADHRGWFVQFATEKCQACNKFAPTWHEVYQKLKWENNVVVVDCTKEDGINPCGRYDIDEFPSLIYFPNAVAPRMFRYQGPLTEEDITRYVMEQEWHQAKGEPFPGMNSSHDEL